MLFPSRFRLSAVAVALSCSPAFAQTTADISAERQIETITVRGEKTDRSIQDTTSSVAVTTALKIEQENLQSLDDILNRTANVSAMYGSRGFTIRGIADEAGASNPLATIYLDGAALPSQIADAGPTDLWDIAQVEVMRGPQSTIQGENALAGAIVMVYNLYKTMKAGSFVANEEVEAAPLPKVIATHGKEHWHRWIEKRPIQMLVFSFIAVAIGGVLEFVPAFLIKSNVPTISSVKPYTPLELHGRDIYIREGCYTCHSQMIRPFRDEVARYGEYSKAGEFVYDHPFLWGSKRTGPDLHREGGKYSNAWHYNHMLQPSSMSPGSIMPNYDWLITQKLDTTTTASKILAMQTLGVPYPANFAEIANQNLDKQAKEIAANLAADKIKVDSDKEIIAIIAYLQRLGTDIKNK